MLRTTGSASLAVKTIRQSVIIPASPAEVYEAFVDPKIHAAFTGSPAKGSRRVGSRFAACGGYIESVHRELVPGKRIVQDWSTTEWPEGAPVSRLELTLKPVASSVVDQRENVASQALDAVIGNPPRFVAQVVATLIGNENPIAGRSQGLDLVAPPVPELRESVKQNDQRTIRRPGLDHVE